jgi:hypothetical protein
MPKAVAFEATSLIINPSTAKPDKNVNVSVVINVIVGSKDVSLADRDSTVVTFTSSSKLTGNHVVGVGTQQ